jgi:hypothetical protein
MAHVSTALLGCARSLLDTNGRSLAPGLAYGACEILEILGFAEILIDRGEADIGDGVERLQPSSPFRRSCSRAPRLAACRSWRWIEESSLSITLRRDRALAKRRSRPERGQLGAIEGLAAIGRP